MRESKKQKAERIKAALAALKEAYPDAKPELKKTSNTVDNYEWVTDEDELDVGDAIAEKDYSQLYGKGKRIRLLEKLFEQKWLNYSQWKREREFEEAYNIDLDF